MTYEQSQRRHLVTSNIEEAVRSVRDKEATGFTLRGVGEVHVKGQYATIHQGVVTVFSEIEDAVTRHTMLVDDVVAVDTNWGDPTGHDVMVMRHQAYVSPSAMMTTVMQLMITALLRGHDPLKVFAGQDNRIIKIAHYAVNGEVPHMLWDVPLAQHRAFLSAVIAVLPGLVELRKPLDEASIAHRENVEEAFADMRAVGMLMPGMFDAEKGREGTPVERALARDGVMDALLHVGDLVPTDAPSIRTPLTADVIDTLDTAKALASVINGTASRAEPFVERANLRQGIEYAAEAMFRLRG